MNERRNLLKIIRYFIFKPTIIADEKYPSGNLNHEI